MYCTEVLRDLERQNIPALDTDSNATLTIRANANYNYDGLMCHIIGRYWLITDMSASAYMLSLSAKLKLNLVLKNKMQEIKMRFG